MPLLPGAIAQLFVTVEWYSEKSDWTGMAY